MYCCVAKPSEGVGKRAEGRNFLASDAQILIEGLVIVSESISTGRGIWSLFRLRLQLEIVKSGPGRQPAKEVGDEDPR